MDEPTQEPQLKQVLGHQKYTIKIDFIVCEGLQEKVLDEVRDLTEYVNKNSLGHASNVKVSVDHSVLADGERHGRM